MPLVSLRDVHLRLNDRHILEQIQFHLEPGETVWLRGANGAGKSSLLKILRGDLWPTAGQRLYHFTDPPRESPIGSRERIALVAPEMQERYGRLNFTASGLEVVKTGFAQTDYLYAPLTAPQRVRAETLLAELRLERLGDVPVNTMSQGQLRQVLLARALVGKPDVLLLDEFFAGVDAESQRRLHELVEGFAANGSTLIYTTHRDEERLNATTRTVTLEAGRLVDGGASGVRRQSPVGAQRAVPLRADHEPLIEVRQANVYLGEPQDDATALDGHALSTRKHVLHDMSLTLSKGEHTALLGANGAGKTTLSKVMLGEISPALGGTVRWFGSPQTPIWERQARIGLVSNDGSLRHRVDADGFTIVASGFSGSVGWHRRLKADEEQKVRDTLELLGVSELGGPNALHVSQGEMRKLLIARALVTGPDVLILDEAFDYLDAASRQQLFHTLESLSGHVTYLVIAHRREDIPDWVRRVVRLEAGRVAWQGELAELRM